MTTAEFFSKKWENEQFSKFLLAPREFDIQMVQLYVAAVIAIPYHDFLEFIKTFSDNLCVLSSDVPQYSNFDAASIGICNALSLAYDKSFKFEEIGELLQPGKACDIVANKKYGENHVKLATDLSLCICVGREYQLSPIGIVYPSLTAYQQDQLISRLVLRNHLVFSILQKCLNGGITDVAEEISFLSASTVKRRKGNCINLCKLIQKNRDTNVENIIERIK